MMWNRYATFARSIRGFMALVEVDPEAMPEIAFHPTVNRVVVWRSSRDYPTQREAVEAAEKHCINKQWKYVVDWQT